jgi:hypothetical protein
LDIPLIADLADGMRLAGLGLQTVVLIEYVRRLLLENRTDERRAAAHSVIASIPVTVSAVPVFGAAFSSHSRWGYVLFVLLNLLLVKRI